MGLDRALGNEAVSTTTQQPAIFTGNDSYISSWNVRETAGTTASVKLRDCIYPLTAPSAVDGAAGNSTAGLHLIALTSVTRHGESIAGAIVEFTTAGTVHITITCPVAVSTGTKVVGRRIYMTKAGAPATGGNPTNAQWFLVAADASTTVAAGMNNMYLPLRGTGSLTVASTTGFAASGNIIVNTRNGYQVVTYTSVDATHFLGCAGPGAGLLATGDTVTQPMIGDNTTTSYDFNLADASLVNTRPTTIDKSGNQIKAMNLSANESFDMEWANPIRSYNKGGFVVEVVSGTVDWTLVGKDPAL